MGEKSIRYLLVFSQLENKIHLKRQYPRWKSISSLSHKLARKQNILEIVNQNFEENHKEILL